MNYAICTVPVAPLRVQPNHRSEMVSQLLFGEYVVIITTQDKGWIQVECKADGYTGWCQQSHLLEIEQNYYFSEKNILAADWVNELIVDGKQMKIPMGSVLNNIVGNKAIWSNHAMEYSGNICNPAEMTRDTNTITQLAFKFLNTTYLWGGRSVFGIDCSGFTQAVYKFLNISLLRDASQQATQGMIVDFLQEVQCGDLAFFDDGDGTITHVGLLLNDHEIIHASGKVRIDKIDAQGIIHSETGVRAQRLRIIKRYL